MFETSPLGNRVLIRPEPRPTQTASGLHLMTQWTPEQTGTVEKVGPGVKEQIAPGDFAIFSWNAGQEVVLDGERFILMREDDVLAVLTWKESDVRRDVA